MRMLKGQHEVYILAFLLASVALSNLLCITGARNRRSLHLLPDSFGTAVSRTGRPRPVARPIERVPPEPHKPTNERVLRNGNWAWNGISKELQPYNVTETNKGTFTEYEVTLPPFYWETPHGLDNVTYDWFFKIPENWRHFGDTLTPVRGFVEVHKNAEFVGPWRGKCNVTHYINFGEGAVNPCDGKPEYEAAILMKSHQTDFFQHFLDNGVPQIMMTLLVTGFDVSKVSFFLDGWRTEAIPRLLKRLGFKEVLRFKTDLRISAETLLLPRICPVIHPILTQAFIDRLNFTDGKGDKVILISRTSGDGTKASRLVKNQGALAERLAKTYGDRFVLFRAKGTKLDDAINLFSMASIVIGSHGGAMYNALWAPRSTKVIELVPSTTDGRYSGQGAFNSRKLPFAHLAIYTNCVMNSQDFFRYYEPGVPINFNISIDRFMNWMREYVDPTMPEVKQPVQ